MLRTVLEIAAEEAGAAATTADEAAGNKTLIIMIVLWATIGLLLYFVPTIVAFAKGHLNKTAVLLLNLFLGWTFIGWVIALVWSVKKTAISAGKSDTFT